MEADGGYRGLCTSTMLNDLLQPTFVLAKSKRWIVPTGCYGAKINERSYQIIIILPFRRTLLQTLEESALH